MLVHTKDSVNTSRHFVFVFFFFNFPTTPSSDIFLTDHPLQCGSLSSSVIMYQVSAMCCKDLKVYSVDASWINLGAELQSDTVITLPEHTIPKEWMEPASPGSSCFGPKAPGLERLDITFLGPSWWPQQQQQKYGPANSKALNTQSQKSSRVSSQLESDSWRSLKLFSH